MYEMIKRLLQNNSSSHLLIFSSSLHVGDPLLITVDGYDSDFEMFDSNRRFGAGAVGRILTAAA